MIRMTAELIEALVRADPQENGVVLIDDGKQMPYRSVILSVTREGSALILRTRPLREGER